MVSLSVCVSRSTKYIFQFSKFLFSDTSRIQMGIFLNTTANSAARSFFRSTGPKITIFFKMIGTADILSFQLAAGCGAFPARPCGAFEGLSSPTTVGKWLNGGGARAKQPPGSSRPSVHRGARRCEPSRGVQSRDRPRLPSPAFGHKQGPTSCGPRLLTGQQGSLWEVAWSSNWGSSLLPNCPRVSLLCGFVISSSFGISLTSHSYKSLTERFHHSQYMRMLPQPFCVLLKLSDRFWRN